MGKRVSAKSAFRFISIAVGLTSGVLSLIREGLMLFDPNRFGGEVLFWRCVWIAFVLSMIISWAMEHRDVLDLRERLDAATKPLFEINRGTFIVAAMSDTKDGAILPNPYAGVLVFLTVFNRGAPSVVAGWKMKATLPDGLIVLGEAFLPNFPITIPRHGGETTFTPDQSLFKSSTVSPIVSGGQASGYVIFKFPLAVKKDLETRGTIIELTLDDIHHTPWTELIKPKGYDDGSGLQTPPSLIG